MFLKAAYIKYRLIMFNVLLPNTNGHLVAAKTLLDEVARQIHLLGLKSANTENVPCTH
jgi:hypothetical protein